MVIDKFTFLDEVDVAGESDPITNHGNGNSLTIEVAGDATSLSMSVEGSVEDGNFDDWTDLAVTNASTNATATSITANGIYTISTKGITYIRMIVDTIESGSVKVFGKLCD